MDETLKQLIELMYVTQKTGALHPLQMKNLQMWGYLTFMWVPPHEVKAYFHHKKRTVTYDIPKRAKLKTKAKRKEVSDSMDRLNLWVQHLLGAEYRVTIEVKGEPIYHGKRGASVPKDQKEPEYQEPPDE